MKRAFTLSEVLITLGIIGIIAAMTLPSLIGNYRRKEVETRLKRAYSLLNQALLSASVKYGEPKDWPDWNSPEKIINNYIAPEFNTLKVYPPSTDKYYTGMCWDGKGFHSGHQYNWMTGVYISSPINLGTTSFMTVDGICIGLYSTSSQNVNFFVDVNGTAKGPNVAGRDLFFFMLSQNTIKPYGYELSLDRLSGTNQSACNAKAPSGGYLCAAKIMKEGWKITYW